MMDEDKKAILINKQDNVATVLSQVKKNERMSITYGREVVDSIISLNDIDIYHKIAVKSINTLENVYKYGEVIGRAVQPIEKGQHVHVANIKGVAGK
ncbi:UxaA family hydrolase [Bacillota bacterium Lsc_1132]